MPYCWRSIQAGMRVRAAALRTWASELQQRLRRAAEHYAQCGLLEFGQLDTLVGREFAVAAGLLLRSHGIAPQTIRAIGSHGQTVLHQPQRAAPFTLQIGDPNIIAERLGYRRGGRFSSPRRRGRWRRRAADAGISCRGLWSAGQYNAVVNIGGIANVTLLHADGGVTGFDTGPGNCLLDAWARRHPGHALRYRRRLGCERHSPGAAAGAHARGPVFSRPPPKSTGRETFSDEWLAAALHGTSLDRAPMCRPH